MDKKIYQSIIDTLDMRINDCKRHFDRVDEVGGLENITVKELVELKDFCVNEYETMTKFAMVDLYHIVGMGNMSPKQMSVFAFKAQAYTSYRPDIKSIALRLQSVTELPGIPAHTKFKLLTFADITLYHGEPEESCEEEICTTSDYSDLARQIAEARPTAPSALYTISNKQITIKKENLAKLFEELAPPTPTKAITVASSVGKALLGIACYGINWIASKEDSDVVVGDIVTKGTINRLSSILNNLKN